MSDVMGVYLYHIQFLLNNSLPRMVLDSAAKNIISPALLTDDLLLTDRMISNLMLTDVQVSNIRGVRSTQNLN